jgi:hypothetical protein
MQEKFISSPEPNLEFNWIMSAILQASAGGETGGGIEAGTTTGDVVGVGTETGAGAGGGGGGVEGVWLIFLILCASGSSDVLDSLETGDTSRTGDRRERPSSLSRGVWDSEVSVGIAGTVPGCPLRLFARYASFFSCVAWNS